MSNTSERVNKIVEIDKNTVEQLIKPYKPEYRVKEFEKFTGGKSTTNYKVIIDEIDLVLVLRIYPNNDTVCEKEFAIFKRVGKHFPIPEIYYINTDKAIINKSYSIMEYLDGITLDRYIEENNRFPKLLAEDIGEKLALLHKHEYDKEGFLDVNLNLTDELPPILTWYNHFLSGYAGQRLEPSTKDKIQHFVKNNEALLSQMTQRMVFSHGDFRPANLMIKDDKLTGILDWEFSLSAPCYFDIGQFIRSKTYLLDDVESHFINGYNRIARHPVSIEWKKLAKLMDLTNLLSMLNAKDERPNLYANMRKLIDEYMIFLTEE